MLIFDFRLIGNKLYEFRKKRGFTRAEVAEKASLSDRTYADIERGSVNMRLETMLKICKVLNITPNDILMDTEPQKITQAELLASIEQCTETQKQTALDLLDVYIRSL